MDIAVVSTQLDLIQSLRTLHKRERDDIIFHEPDIVQLRCDLFRIVCADTTIGYCVLHGDTEVRDHVIEFFLLPMYRHLTLHIFDTVLQRTGAKHITVMTSDTFLTLLFYDYVSTMSAPIIFFRDHATTSYSCPDVIVRPITLDDQDCLWPILSRPDARPFYRPTMDELRQWIARDVAWLIERDQVVIGIGAVYHDQYNAPYANIAMYVRPAFRQCGYGTYIVQEMKRVCYKYGCLPSARCAAENILSRLTLQRAGFLPNARMLVGTIDRR